MTNKIFTSCCGRFSGNAKMLADLLTIQLFGFLQVRVHNEPLPRLRPRSAEWLLALLTLRKGRAAERSWLAGTLWPDSTETQALHNLRNGLLILRKALGNEGIRLQSPTRSTLLFDLTGAKVDVVRFDQTIREGSSDALREAVTLYTGSLLEGCDEVWVTLERNRREQACLTALETLAQRAEADGDHLEAIRYLRESLVLDGLREGTVRSLMSHLADNGDPAEAVTVYREFRKRLHQEMNAFPDSKTLRLFQQIREGGRQPANRRHAIHGTGQTSETLKAIEDAPSSRMPLRVMTRPPHALVPLIGRTEEVERLRESVLANRLVTLVGAGGIGKTRLAMEVSAQMEEEFAAGAIWLELASLTQGAQILPTLAKALELRQESRSDPDTLRAALFSCFSERSYLLVLDNCEHLIDAAGEITRSLLSHCPLLHILATSRQQLGLKGEIVRRVPSLSAPSAEELPSDPKEAYTVALTYPAVRLFVERAAAVRHSFALNNRREAEAVCQICRRLDGIPLALELAAARANVLSVEQIASRLHNRFHLLTEGSRTDPPRHQTLRALIDWSYEQLPEAERVLLRRVSVFAGGWGLDAAEAVFLPEDGSRMQNAADILNVLSSLVNRSLVLAEEHRDGLRYRMLETVREYALERLRERGEEEAVRRLHADYFLMIAETAQSFISTQDLDWLEVFDTEHDNFRGALILFMAQEETQDKAIRLAAALAVYWNLRSHTFEQRTFLLELARRPSALTEACVRVLDYAAGFQGTHGERSEAERMYRQMLAAAKKLNYSIGVAQALNGLAWLLSNTQYPGPGYDFDAARMMAEESLTLMREQGERQGIVDSLFRLGSITQMLGDFQAARTYFLECRALDQELGVKGGLALLRLGEVAFSVGDCDEAKHCILPFLVERQEMGERWGIAYGLFELGKVILAEGGWEHAARLLGASLAVKESLSQTLSESERTMYAPLRLTLQESLGEAVCTHQWNIGTAMTLQEAVKYALQSMLKEGVSNSQ